MGAFMGLLLFARRSRFNPAHYVPPFEVQRDIREVSEGIRRVSYAFAESTEDRTTHSVAYKGQLTMPFQQSLASVGDQKTDIYFLTVPHYPGGTEQAELDEMELSFERYLASSVEVKGIFIVKELHEDGSPHLHIVIKTDKPFPNIGMHAQQFLSSYHSSSTLTVDCQPVRDLGKVTAYLLKDNIIPQLRKGCFSDIELQKPQKKLNNTEILARIIDKIINECIDPWEFLNSADPREKVTAFKNKKSLDMIYQEALRNRALRTRKINLPPPPEHPELLKIWNWLSALQNGKIYEPTFAPRHIYISGRPNTRKSSLASMIQSCFRTYMTNVSDAWWDGYRDDYDVAIIDEFTVVDPGKNGKCIVTLNRFMESARGQPLPIKYSAAQKFNTCLPVMIISNLTKETMVSHAMRYFDESQVAAFIRRFTFVDLGSTSIPTELTYIGMTTPKEDKGTQYSAPDNSAQQFSLNIRIFDQKFRIWLVKPNESGKDIIQTYTTYKLADDEYVGIPINVESEAFKLFTDAQIRQPFQPWTTFTYQHQNAGRYGFTISDSLNICIQENNSVAIQQNSLPDVRKTFFWTFRMVPGPGTAYRVHTIGRPSDSVTPWVEDNWILLEQIIRCYYKIGMQSKLSTTLKQYGTSICIVNGADLDWKCAICLQGTFDTTLTALGCLHPFHWGCLAGVISTDNPTCPFCRIDLEDSRKLLSGVTEPLCACTECAQCFRATGMKRKH
jgi:hypothetical protein